MGQPELVLRQLAVLAERPVLGDRLEDLDGLVPGRDDGGGAEEFALLAAQEVVADLVLALEDLFEAFRGGVPLDGLAVGLERLVVVAPRFFDPAEALLPFGRLRRVLVGADQLLEL